MYSDAKGSQLLHCLSGAKCTVAVDASTALSSKRKSRCFGLNPVTGPDGNVSGSLRFWYATGAAGWCHPHDMCQEETSSSSLGNQRLTEKMWGIKHHTVQSDKSSFKRVSVFRLIKLVCCTLQRRAPQSISWAKKRKKKDSMAVKWHLGKSSKNLRYRQSHANSALLCCNPGLCERGSEGDENRSNFAVFSAFSIRRSWSLDELTTFFPGEKKAQPLKPIQHGVENGSRIVKMSGGRAALHFSLCNVPVAAGLLALEGHVANHIYIAERIHRSFPCLKLPKWLTWLVWRGESVNFFSGLQSCCRGTW